MCKRSKGVQDRRDPGAEVFQVKTDQTERADNDRELLQAIGT